MPPMAEQAPEIRASWTRRVLRHAEDLPQRIGPSVRARVPGPLLAELEQAGPLAWLPASTHALVIQSVYDEIGAERYVSLYRAMTLDGLARPLFGPLARGAVSLFGRSAAGLERMFPRGWGLVSRGCGRMSAQEARRGHAVMVLEGIPEILRQTETYALGFKGAFDACGDFIGSPGTCAMDTTALGEGCVRYVLEWNE